MASYFFFLNLLIAGKILNNSVEYWNCSTVPSPFILTVFHRKQGPKQRCTASFVPPNQGSLHQGPSLGMVWSYLYEARVLWLFSRYIKLLWVHVFSLLEFSKRLGFTLSQDLPAYAIRRDHWIKLLVHIHDTHSLKTKREGQNYY